MDKEQAIQAFWESFGLPAYDEYAVPDDAKMPYITYTSMTGAVGDVLALSGSIWYYSPSWKDISRKRDEIAQAVGSNGYYIQAIDGGYLWIKRGSPFSQRMSEPGSDMTRRMYINLLAEFLTAY